jgi:hypothetical protein
MGMLTPAFRRAGDVRGFFTPHSSPVLICCNTLLTRSIHPPTVRRGEITLASTLRKRNHEPVSKN